MPRPKTPRDYDPNPLDNNKEFRVYAYFTKEDYQLFLKSKAVIRNQLVAINKIRPNENISQTEIIKSMMIFFCQKKNIATTPESAGEFIQLNSTIGEQIKLFSEKECMEIDKFLLKAAEFYIDNHTKKAA